MYLTITRAIDNIILPMPKVDLTINNIYTLMVSFCNSFRKKQLGILQRTLFYTLYIDACTAKESDNTESGQYAC